MKESRNKIIVRMVCPTTDCSNSIVSNLKHVSGENGSDTGALIFYRSEFEFICESCGTIMERKIIRATLTETETEIKPGETNESS